MRNGKLTVLIADDEAPARARLASMLHEAGGWEVVGEAAHGEAVLETCGAEMPDVVLLDIRMPGMDGIETAARICEMPEQPMIVFTTAYDEYAVRAFETHAVDYLLKPVRRERLLRALEQAAKLNRMKLAALAEATSVEGRRQIPITLGNNLELVPVDDVLAFRADQKYVQMLYEKDGGVCTGLIDTPLKNLEEELAHEFVRVHRNALVRFTHIGNLGTLDNGQHEVRLHGCAESFPVSRRHYAALKQRLRV